MKKRFFGSLALASAMAVGANAVDFDVFGHLGTAYSFGIDKVLTEKGSEKPWFGGFTGRIGAELGMGPVSIGLGFAGGAPYAISPSGMYSDLIRNGRFTEAKDVKWYNWMSDAYLRVDTRMFSIAGGRYNLDTFFMGKDGKSHTGVDWISGQNEGVSFKLDTRYLSWWGIYTYETMDFGARDPKRLGNDLMGFHQYGKVGHLISTGFDINIKEVIYVDPFFTYNIDSDYWQAGGKVQADFGKGVFKSSTILRGMYQNTSGTSTFLAWADQQFLINNVFKFGGGGYYVGNDEGIIYLSERTRFYGNTFGWGTDYFEKGNGVWYVFAGIEHKIFNFDFLYADGDYKEISAIAQVNLYKNRWTELGIGGGWVRSDGFDKGVVFTKLSF